MVPASVHLEGMVTNESLAGLFALAALLLPGAALARELKVTDADVRLRLADDASLLVAEKLKFNFEGQWQAAFRDIPLDPGEAKLFAGMAQLVASRDGFRPLVLEGSSDLVGIVTVHDGPSLAQGQIAVDSFTYTVSDADGAQATATVFVTVVGVNDAPVGVDDVKEDLARRDHADSNREVSPLRAADDAIVIDTTDRDVNETVDEIVSRVRAVTG